MKLFFFFFLTKKFKICNERKFLNKIDKKNFKYTIKFYIVNIILYNNVL